MHPRSLSTLTADQAAPAVAGVRGGVVVVGGVVIGLRGLLLIGSCRGEDHQEA